MDKNNIVHFRMIYERPQLKRRNIEELLSPKSQRQLISVKSLWNREIDILSMDRICFVNFINIVKNVI